jgi:dihydrofolate reductase
MRPVVAYLFYSLDGVVTAPDRWVFDFDDEMAAHLGELVGGQDAVLLGRATYEMWAPYWPTATDEPFASFINNVPKYVASTTLTEVTWNNSTLVKGSIADEIARLKQEPGRDIGVHGSPSLVRSLLRDGLLDELRLAVPPVVAGSGERLFDGSGEVRRLRLTRSQRTPTGALLLGYSLRQA